LLDSRVQERLGQLDPKDLADVSALTYQVLSAPYWQAYVGGGQLIYTRNGEGRRILLQARAQQRKHLRQMAFEIWK
jgi:hypothetical protein